MIFSEKMALVPQPRRAALWTEYRTLCTALALQVNLRRERRTATEEELNPLKDAAKKANEILAEFGMEPSFFPEREDFFPLLTEELASIAKSPKHRD